MEIEDSQIDDESLYALFVDFQKAIDDNNEEKIKIILKKRGIITKKFTFPDLSLLHVATKRGTINIVKQLCQQEGIDINMKNRSGETPIFNAIKNSSEMTKLLLNNNAAVNVVCKNGLTPLYHALLHGDLNTVCLLLEKLIDVKFFHETGENSGEMNKKELSKNDEEFKGKEEEFKGSEEKLKGIEEELNKDEKAKKLERVVKILLEYKKELGLNEKDYPLLIYFAAQLKIRDILDLVLKDVRESTKNFDSNSNLLNTKGDYDRTALHYAVREGKTKIVNFFLKEGANPNCKTKMDFTPLHYAVALENLEICCLLLANGADVNAESISEGSPLYVIAGRSELKNLVKSTDSYYYDERHNTFINRMNSYYEPEVIFNREIMELLLKNGANTECHSKEGVTPFLEACRAGLYEEAKILLNHKANCYARDFENNSALHHAAIGCSLEIIDLLIDEKKFDVDVKNENDYTPLMCAVQNERRISLETIEYFVERGANINARNKRGATCLHIAAYFDLTTTVRCLIELGANWQMNFQTDNYNSPAMGEILSSFYFPGVQTGRKWIISLAALKNSNETIDNFLKSYVGSEKQILQDANDYFQKSKIEVNKLKQTAIINEMRVSYYDFLTKDHYSCYKFVKNLKFRETLSKGDYKNEFPCYEKLLEGRFKRVENLEDSIDRVVGFLTDYGDKIQLPITAVDIILGHFRSFDFRAFGRLLARKRF
ncbi:putative ankyrin repeat protein RF_0381 [Leptopilina heterotoma]|uniref:putative ankyrin repeat protein RF_0381 n=1 Tax=Leptopilina heterotoma TaxID=63436 RepID=UPI001CA7FAE7|nr:putative ankyrin repeat protein RF_0381 [Leptopilina heterotoma]